MPITSVRQYGAMQAASHNQGAIGIPPSVGKDFVNATSSLDRSKFAKALAKKKKKKK